MALLTCVIPRVCDFISFSFFLFRPRATNLKILNPLCPLSSRPAVSFSTLPGPAIITISSSSEQREVIGGGGKLAIVEAIGAAALIPMLLLVGASAQTIRVDSTNPHYYFFRGKPTVLITSAEHYGAVVNGDFDYVKYLNALQSYGLNYTLFEPLGKYMTGNTLGVKPASLVLPWARSSQPGYLLSGDKFDLDRWNPAYFAHLKDFIAQAAKRGIVVEVCLFNGQYDDTWPLSPLYHENNIQGVGQRGYRDAQTLKDPALVEREAAYIRKMVQEVNGFDNVILEVTHNAEMNLPKKHLIGQEVQGPVDGAIDFSGSPFSSIVVTQYLWHTHDWEMGGLQGLDREYRHNKPIEQNETNYYPLYTGDAVADSRVEAWEFMVGGGASFNQLNGLYTVEDPAGNTPDNLKILGALRSLKSFIDSFSFVNMVPDKGFVLSGFDRETHYRGLSQYGRQYALYIHHSEGGGGASYIVTPGQYRENLVLNLPPGSYKAEWIDPASFATMATDSFMHAGGTRTLVTPTYTIDIALRITRE